MAAFASQFKIGDPVFVELGDVKVPGNIRVVLHTQGKVRYSVRVFFDVNSTGGKKETGTTLHNLDSVFVKENKDGDFMELDFDNYS